jgi:hypothetical protein
MIDAKNPLLELPLAFHFKNHVPLSVPYALPIFSKSKPSDAETVVVD